MKIEKLSENKIRITLNLEDLKEKDIDFHSFMSNSLESQELFLDMLEEAEKEVGFSTKDYRIVLEALATSEGDFIITVTRILEEKDKTMSKNNKRINVKRKVAITSFQKSIFCFNNFDDYCSFCEGINTKLQNNLAKKISLYIYNSRYYLVLNKINVNIQKSLYSYISEFAHFVNNPDLFERKLIEYGKLIMKHNAINTCIKHFAR